MILIYVLIGIVTSVVGALPLGASNIVVINTTIKQNLQQAMKIAITAGVAEVVLSFYALNYNMLVKDFFSSNQWLQVLIALLLLGIGSLLFFKKQQTKSKTINKQSLFKSKYATGFLLGLLNPPVLVYWLLVYGIINSNVVMLSTTSSATVLILFFLGVYIGKVFTLYIYGRFSIFMQQRFKNVNLLINKVTGSLLFTVGIFQFVKIYFI
ncbi:LysE family transporter [Winogradskyella jejuensis]|uniref:Threonine/homoserine/homoserine lactone efflux protein n=1 Tax=Winogradskyella jejuensis TaxID=1089305 RepID=A0A1M5LNR7_9FLAO|nr:LysE family transporter [Winogradskyella jejuensis]SHG66727.1 Threonine/homoserine/homoserine lactone efflux protein [Winogradskyella jejuensis]